MQRRDFIKLLSSSYLSLHAPSVLAKMVSQNNYSPLLVLIQLKGGNDTLNTLVPLNDPLYKELRPKLSINRDQTIPISKELGMHSSLKGMHKLYNENKLSIVNNVGHEINDFSHFSNTHFWDSGALKAGKTTGWLHDHFQKDKFEGLILGGVESGPLNGLESNTLFIHNPKQYQKLSKKMKPSEFGRYSNPMLEHILNVESSIQKSLTDLKMDNSFKDITNTVKGKNRRHLAAALSLAKNKKDLKVIKITIGGFDTHKNQITRHSQLLKELDQMVIALVNGLKKIGRFDNSVIMTYSEFGRRAYENGSLGTDHGAASSQFIIAPKINNKFLGGNYSLKELDKGNLKYQIDFRQVYSTVANQLWGKSKKELNIFS